MGQSVLSIYVGNEVIRICEVTRNSGKSITMNNACEIVTPNGCVEDGKIINISALGEALKTSIYGRGFSAKKIMFTITSKKIANKEVFIPYIKNQQSIREMLISNSREYFPMSNVNDYVFAYSVLDTVVVEDMKKLRLSAIAAPKDIVESYYQLAEEIKMPIQNIDFVGNSVLQLLGLQMKEGTELVLQIEKDATYVNVMSGSTMILQRSVPYGQNAVVGALMEIKHLTEKDAKNLLKHKDLLDQQVTEKEYGEAVRYLISSIGRIAEYYTNMHPEATIEGIKVFGEGSTIAGIDEVLKHELGSDVSHFETLQGLTIKANSFMSSEEVLRYLPNLGAVLHPVGLTMEYGNVKGAVADYDKLLFVGLAVAGAIAIVMVAVTAFGYFRNVDERDTLTKQVAELKPVEECLNQFNIATANYQIFSAYHLTTQNPNENLYELVTTLETVMPTSVGISSLQVSNGAVSFSATATGKIDVAELIIQLKKVTFISNVFVSNISETYVESGVPTSTFSLTCQIIQTEGGAQ